MRVPWEGLREEETCEIIYHLFISIYLDFPGGPANAGDMRRRLDPWLAKIPWRRKQQPTPVFWPEESHGQRNLAGYTP